MAPNTHRRPTSRLALLAVLGSIGITMASCTTSRSAPAIRSAIARATAPARGQSSSPTGLSPAGATSTAPAASSSQPGTAAAPLPAPTALAPFSGNSSASSTPSPWSPTGRTVNGIPAVYETTMIPPGGTQPAGIAWMDTRLLSARLYSGSVSPGGGPYTYTAPIQPAQAASLVAAFNGGFMMSAAHGGYYTEGRMVDPLVTGAASLVIDTNGNVTIGPWGGNLSLTPQVASVRQNLVPLVAGGQPTPAAASPDWQAWGATCAATTCSGSVPGLEHQWRSGVGTTADGALVYTTGPALDPLQLAQLLVAAGCVQAMQLDINPDWPVLATYDPSTPGGLAAPSNGTKLLASTIQGPWTFFESWWARDFVTMSARVAAP